MNVYLTPKSDSVLTLIKIGSSVIQITAKLFIYCYLFDSINIKRQLVNFGIYTCNWTKMDLKFKKLLLLTMQMNNANRMVIKASPKKVINLQLFANYINVLQHGPDFVENHKLGKSQATINLNLTTLTKK
ncbi:odorant receptor 46a-like [Aphis craccivora]|uniref:Odorant receptor 46a-like n=1 Tax=Aphis craccivora TaxID=307492 RepID=A0A6G0VWP8_APHCR|nr:odorant receptor 46a-like [Aphis craccivora]